MHSCLVRKNPCLSVASLDFFDDILKAENSFSNETGRQATAPALQPIHKKDCENTKNVFTVYYARFQLFVPALKASTCCIAFPLAIISRATFSPSAMLSALPPT